MIKRYVVLITFVLIICGCMDTATRFWNSGGSSFYWNEKTSFAWKECSQKLNEEELYSSNINVYYFMKTCMAKKGF